MLCCTPSWSPACSKLALPCFVLGASPSTAPVLATARIVMWTWWGAFQNRMNSTDAEVSRSHLRLAYSTDEQRDCVIVCESPRAAGIAFEVVQDSHQFLKSAERQFKIHVPSDCYGMAEEVIRKDQVDFTDEPEDQKIMELVASGDGISIPVPADKDWDRRTGTWRMPLSRSGVKAIRSGPR
jgi:hypothetical protein